jgi:hypothetical protein
MIELSNGQTVPTWYPIGLYRASSSPSERTPQPENSFGPIRCMTTDGALSASTIPLHSRCPMLEDSASTWVPSASRARAKYPSSATQKSRLNRSFSSAASRSSRSAYAGSCQNSRASRAPRTFASYA